MIMISNEQLLARQAIDRLKSKLDAANGGILIDKVIFNPPATVVYFGDGSKTVVRCSENDTFDKEKGFALALVKRACGNTGKFNDLFRHFIDGGHAINFSNKKRDIPVYKMRRELADMCHETLCNKCPLGGENFKCGRGYFFTSSKDTKGYMDDGSIVEHYKAMKEAGL